MFYLAIFLSATLTLFTWLPELPLCTSKPLISYETLIQQIIREVNNAFTITNEDKEITNSGIGRIQSNAGELKNDIRVVNGQR